MQQNNCVKNEDEHRLLSEKLDSIASLGTQLPPIRSVLSFPSFKSIPQHPHKQTEARNEEPLQQTKHLLVEESDTNKLTASQSSMKLSNLLS